MRKCPFNKAVKCDRPEGDCRICEVRKRVQKSLTPEQDSKYRMTYEQYGEGKVMCPYCLYEDYSHKFYMKLAHGRTSEKRFQCPDCNQVMQKKTLYNSMSVEQFAEWMFDTLAWSRVSFTKFNNRLKEMGISYQFWKHYKEYKQEKTGGRTGLDDYEEHLMQEQEEWMEEQKRQPKLSREEQKKRPTLSGGWR